MLRAYNVYVRALRSKWGTMGAGHHKSQHIVVYALTFYLSRTLNATRATAACQCR